VELLWTGHGLDLDVDEERCELVLHLLDREALASFRPLALGRRRHDLAQLAAMVEPDRRRTECPARPKDARDLGERARPVLDVKEHVVGDRRIERRVEERQLLHVRHRVLRAIGEHGACSLDHAGREVGQRETPTSWDAVEILPPDVRVPAADLEHVRIVPNA